MFYGSFDWHSCVEMHWVLVRLLKVAGDAVPAAGIRAALDRQFAPAGLRAEAEFMRAKGGFERPYGWGWALALAHELATWPGDQDAPRWAAAMEPLASALADNFLGWLPKATYPVRTGLHTNSSFGLSLALSYARALAGPGRRPQGSRPQGRRLQGRRRWARPSRTRRAGGTSPTLTTRRPGNRRDTTSSRPRWPKPS